MTVKTQIYMVDKEQIQLIIEDFKAKGKSVRVRDIAYTLLSKMFSDNSIAYQCLSAQRATRLI